MKLLICAQSVNEKDPILGFFHRWLIELSKHFDHIIVICLRSGEYSLPSNVEVLTLGGTLRFQRMLEICAIALGRRKDYDAVFVHMSQEFILASGWLWKLLGKRMYMWRNHYDGSKLTDIAASFTKKVFCTSMFSYTAKYKKTVIMPVGIDIDNFHAIREVKKEPRSVLFFGRLAPSKRPEILLEAISILHRKGMECSVTLCGPSEEIYHKALEKKIELLRISHLATLLPAIPNTEAPELFSKHEVYVNCSPSGMYDKTIFEAAACGALVLATSKDFAKGADPRTVAKENAEDIAEKIATLVLLSPDEKDTLRASLRARAEEHSLKTLGERLAKEMQV